MAERWAHGTCAGTLRRTTSGADGHLRPAPPPPARAAAPALLLLFLLTEGSALAGPNSECSLSARIDGEPALIAPVRRLLLARGISAPASPDCPAPVVEVQIRAAHPGFDVSIFDQEGRLARKIADSPATAALLIESWARGDLTQPLLPASTAPAPAERAVPAGSLPVHADVAARLHRPTTSRAPGLFTLTADSVVAGDGVAALGASAGLCARLSWSCLGVLGRAHRSWIGASASEQRRGLDILVAGQVPLSWGPVVLSPVAAVGAGWQQVLSSSTAGTLPTERENPPDGNVPGGRTSGRRSDGPGDDDPRDGRGGRSSGRGDGSERQAGTMPAAIGAGSAEGLAGRLRASLGVNLAVPLAGGLSLAFGVSLGLPGQARAGVGLGYGHP